MKYKGYIFAIISAAFYASIGIFVKNGISKEFSPIDLIMLQEIITIVILFVVCIIKYRNEVKLTREMLVRLIILGGGANTLMMILNYESYKYLSIAVATVILYTYPAIVAIISVFIFKQKISGYKIFAIIGTFVGCLLVINIFSPRVLSTLNVKGLIFAFLSALVFAFLNMYAARILQNTTSFVVTFYNAIFTLTVLLIFNFKFVSKLKYVNVGLLMNTTLLAVLCGIIPTILFYSALKSIGSIPTSIIGTLEIPIAAMLSFLIMGDSLYFVQVSGVVLALVSVILLKFERKSEILIETLE